MILPAQCIRSRPWLVTPFYGSKQVHENGMSYGLSCCGYDVRVDQDILLWPKGHCLASTVERFQIDLDLAPTVLDKSSWARRFVTVQNTIMEPGWCGYLTLEITNHSWKFVRIKRGTPIAQIVFNQLSEPTDMPYAGKYQNQERGPQPCRREKSK